MFRKITFFSIAALFFSFIDLVKSVPGTPVDCGNGFCERCYDGIWEQLQDKCRVVDCQAQVDNVSYDWCRSCNQTFPFPNFQRNVCVKSDCRNITISDTWCKDCSDLTNKIADYKSKVCTFNCKIPPQKGNFTKDWCEICERPKIFLSDDKNSCKSSDCNIIPALHKFTNIWCQDCKPSTPFANLDRVGCQNKKVNRTFSAIKILFNFLFFISLLI